MGSTKWGGPTPPTPKRGGYPFYFAHGPTHFVEEMKVTKDQTLIVSDELVDMINIHMLKIHPSCKFPGMQQKNGTYLGITTDLDDQISKNSSLQRV